MYFITIKRMLEVCFSAHPNIQYRAKKCPRTLDKVPGDIYYVDIVCSKTGRICPNVYR